MSKVRLGSISAAALLLVSAGLAPAADISAKKILIKDNADTTKRQILVLSKDLSITKLSGDNPSIGGASIHVYGGGDDYCAILAPGPLWQDLGTKWKYVDPATRNVAQIKDEKILLKVRADDISISLADAPQTAMNVQVQFGTGTRYCMKCNGNIKDDIKKFLGKDCAATACDAEPSTCDPPNPTTTSSTSTTSTSTTSTTIGGLIALVLPPSNGRFNYAGLGLPGADARCNTLVAGTAHCTLADLQAAEAASELDGITDTNGMTVNSFWAIDNAANVQTQCIDDVIGGSFLNWEYNTAHTGTSGQRVTLNNPTGVLSAVGAAGCGASHWVGCCP
jgi:hypothetical protein